MKISNPLIALLFGLCLTGASACGTEEAIQCTDICDELDTCDENFDLTSCYDTCESQSDANIDTCNDCLDASENECTDCSAECVRLSPPAGAVLPQQ